MIDISSDSDGDKSNDSNSKPSKNKELFAREVELESSSENKENFKAD